MCAGIQTHQCKSAQCGPTVQTAVFRVIFTGFVRSVAPPNVFSGAEIRPPGCQVGRLSDRPFSGPLEHSSACDRYARQG